MFRRYTTKGKTTFEGVVTVKNLNVSLLDNIDLNKAVTKDAKVKITERKNFDTLVVAENVKANSSVLISINNINLKLLQAEALYVDEETTLTLPHVNFNDLNGSYFKKSFGKVQIDLFSTKPESHLLE